MNDQKLKPLDIKGNIKLSSKNVVKVNKNAVSNTGINTSAKKLINSLKKAAKEEVFPPLVTS